MSRVLQTVTAVGLLSFGLSSAESIVAEHQLAIVVVDDRYSTSTVATVTNTVAAQLAPLPPSGLYVSELRGNRVTLRWTAPFGLTPTAFIVEGAGSVEATIVTGPTPILTFDAPTGAYFARVRTQSGAQLSGLSNEIQVFVNVPVAPSAPENLVALVNGTTVTLAWRNSFAGGEPTSLVLDVTGSVTGTLPLALTDTVTSTVAAGTYTLALRAVNGAGSSFPSSAVTVTVPDVCPGAPLTPTNFLAYNLGSTMFAVWEPSATGPAPTAYVLNVSGAFAGSFSTAGRQLSATVGPGSYTFNLVATNPCGTSATTASQTVTIPSGGAPSPSPQLLTIDSAHVARVRESLLRGEPQFKSALTELEAEANRALSVAPMSVMDKGVTPPSGDKHDYMSQAPYWWPDPSKPNGRPYIRRDGERNPEISRITDRENLGRLDRTVTALALAFHLTGREEYAQHAARLLRVWFLDPATRMNPHLRFGQGIPGRAEGRSAGIIETRFLPRIIIDAVTLLQSSSAWTASENEALKDWMRAYLTWLLESPLGREQARRGNNQETWADVQIVALALYTGQTEIARQVLEDAKSDIADEFEPDGRQPRELARTRSWDYSIFDLTAFLHLAALGERVGVDLWNYRTGDGRSLRQGLEYLVPFATSEGRWPHQQITELRPSALHPVLRRAAVGWNEPKYRELAHQIGGGTRRLELTLP